MKEIREHGTNPTKNLSVVAKEKPIEYERNNQ